MSLCVIIIFFIKTTWSAIHDVQIVNHLKMDFQNLHGSSLVPKNQPLTDVSLFDSNESIIKLILNICSLI